MKLSYFTLLIVTLLAGCAGVGMVYTSDPHQKLENATVLYEQQNRPLAANRLFMEVISTCEESKDRICLARAWENYGAFLRSETVERWENEHGKGAFPADRYDQSAVYFGKAATTLFELQYYGNAANAYLDQAKSYEMAQRTTEACAAYLKTLDPFKKNYEEYLAKHPGAKPYTPAGFTSYEEFINAQRERIGCHGG